MTMEIINEPHLMQIRSAEIRASGKKIGFVPTMGALHAGHLSLITEAKKRSDVVVMSIYLNPTQFGPKEDLNSYPSNLERDLELAKNCGVDIVFCPSNKTMYPEGFQTYVETIGITKGLCGATRGGHFKGVTTVVLKLFNIVKPHVAIFGEKDYQQLQVIRRMSIDLDLDIEIVGSPTVREEDGLAMSSRNAYLTPTERKAARSINQALNLAKKAAREGDADLDFIIANTKAHIEATKISRIDYVKICDPESLDELKTFKTPALLAIAAYFGKARLIDNCILK